MKDETLGKLWARHEVLEKAHGAKLVHHPLVGDLDLDYETPRPVGDPDVVLAVYTAKIGSPTGERLKQPASRAASVNA